MSSNASNSSYPNGQHSNGKYNGELKPKNAATAGLNKKNDDEIDLFHLFHIGWRYKWLMIIALTVGITVSYLMAEQATPIYRGDGSLMIAEARNRYSMAGSDISTLLTSNFGIGMGSTIANELQIIKSIRFNKDVAYNIIERADGDYEKYPITFFEEDDLDFELTPAKRAEFIAYRLIEGVRFDRVELDSDVLRVSFESPSRTEAAEVVNIIIDTYNEFSEYENRRMARQGLNFLERERDIVVASLQESEENLRNFMNTEGLVAIDEQSRKLVEMLSDLMIERQRAEVQKVTIDSAIENFSRELNSIGPGLADQVARSIAPKLSRFQFQQAELETERMLILSRNPSLRDNPQTEPRLASLDKQINDLENQIRDLVNEMIEQDERFIGFLGSSDGNLVNDLSKLRQNLLELEIESRQLEAQKSILDERIAVLERDFERLPDNMVTMARLQRQMKMNEDLFVLLSRQAAEVSIWEQTQLGYGRIVDYSPVPIRPVKPRKIFFLLAGFLIGGIVGVSIIVVRELTQTQITSIDKLRDAGYPVLTVVPDLNQVIQKQFAGRKTVELGSNKVSTDLITLLDPISPASESYRRLFNNIIYSQPDVSYQTLITTSAGQSEGKTIIMCNLGIVMAETDHKVVIVDADFRRPRIHQQFGLQKTPGVSEWLFHDNELEEVIEPSVVPGLDTITAGRSVKNPANLVQSKRMKELISELKKRYDFVLIDVPPFGILSDAAPLMNMADGIVLISRFGVTRNIDFTLTIENLQNIKVPIIGTAMTAFDYDKSTDYGYKKDYYKNSYMNYNKYVTEEK